MRRPVLANLDDLDPETRRAAEAAARKAGLRLEDWVGGILADRLARQASLRPARRRPGDDLDEIIDRMGKVARKSGTAEPADTEWTAGAIEAVAQWIEKAEERLDESVRHTADSQDRMASAMSDALSALKDRLDAVERRVVSERAPARVEFPVEDAVRVLSPLTDTLLGLRTDVSRLADRLDQPLATPWVPAVDAIGAQIEDLRAVLAALATRDEIDSLDGNVRSLSKDLEKRPSGAAVLTLASAIATLHGQVADLSDELTQGIHARIREEIDGVERKIDRLAENGIDRTVVDFLSSQIVDMRHDLATRAEPRQIERLSAEVAALSAEIGELRSTQVGRADFASLKAALEKVCQALSQSVARQEENNVPDQIRGLGDKLDALARRPEPEPANLEPIAAQLTLLTERMVSVADRRFDENGAVQAQFDRLSSQIDSALQTSSASQAPLWERFEKLEADLRRVGERADTSSLEQLVRSLHDKLRPTPPAIPLKALRDEAAAIAERAAKAAIRESRDGVGIPPGDGGSLDHRLAELKSLQSRADSTTQQTLRAVHEALEILVARLGDPEHPAQARPVAASRDGTQPPDRLEAAVRRLHAVALSQVEDVSARRDDPAPGEAGDAPELRPAAVSISGHEPGLVNVRASFIAAARRASQTHSAAPSEEESQMPEQAPAPKDGTTMPSEAQPLATRGLIERLRKAFHSQRRPLLFGVALLAMAAGTAENLSRASADGAATPLANVAAAGAAPVASAAPVDVASSDDAPIMFPDALRQAVAAGIPAALYEMASRLDRPGDRADAARLLALAAQAGLAPAQQRLGALYEQGYGVEKNPARALSWYERAAQGGNLQAMHRLATLIAAGAQGEPDDAAAFRWYTEAAEGGLRDSQFNLGVLLTRGVGTPRNLPRAYQWFDVAARQGDADAAAKRNEVAKQLAPPALAAAKLLSERWRPRPADPAANAVEWTPGGRTAAFDPRPGGKT